MKLWSLSQFKFRIWRSLDATSHHTFMQNVERDINSVLYYQFGLIQIYSVVFVNATLFKSLIPKNFRNSIVFTIGDILSSHIHIIRTSSITGKQNLFT